MSIDIRSLKSGKNILTNKSWLFAMVFLLLIFLDQVIKIKVENNFLNKNFAFSIPLPMFFAYSFYFAVLAVIFWYLKKKWQSIGSWELFAWLLILSGAFSNIGERLILGYVRDWFYVSAFGWVGIYNLADGYILLGICLLLLLGIKKKETHQSKTMN